MAITVNINDAFGNSHSIYLRLIIVDANNHNAASLATFRGFKDKESFMNCEQFIHEESIELKVDVTKNIWEQVYNEIKSKYPLHADV